MLIGDSVVWTETVVALYFSEQRSCPRGCWRSVVRVPFVWFGVFLLGGALVVVVVIFAICCVYFVDCGELWYSTTI